MKRYQLRIDGQACEPQGGAWFETQNPYTGTAWAEIPRCDARDVDSAVQAAHRALTQGPWAHMTATQRGALMRKLGDLIARGYMLARAPYTIQHPVVGRDVLQAVLDGIQRL